MLKRAGGLAHEFVNNMARSVELTFHTKLVNSWHKTEDYRKTARLWIKYGYRSILQLPCTSSVQLVASMASASDDKTTELPRLPVPRLSDTLTKYLFTVRPHLSDEEFSTTTDLVKQFGTKDGMGHKLQELLEERAKKHTNWLEDWWVHSAYLDFRWPVVVYSNPGLVFPFRKFATQDDQLRYAAQTILAALDYKLMIDADAIPQEKMGKAPLDMSQYKKVFGTCRVPGVTRDTQSFNNSNYITVMRRGHIFHVDMWGGNGNVLNEEQTMEQLRQLVNMSEVATTNPIGVLTSENRNTWGKAYQAIAKYKENLENLKDVERSLMVVCLDEAVGLWRLADKSARQNAAAAQTIHGGGSQSNGCNRWFDKTIQFIIGEDGVTGLTYEHSPAEGQPIAVLTDFIMDFISSNKSSERPAATHVTAPRRLHFKVTPEVEKTIRIAANNLDKMVEDLDINCFTYEKYGKDFIKSHKLSPDSYLQMAMQYAFYRLHKTPGAHYESAATRMYMGGRTETIRSCSTESVLFAQTMLDENIANDYKLSTMKAAIKAHKDYTVQALQGLGVDRHLLGLKLIAIENGIDLPKLFLDTGFVKSGHMRISTSQVACRCDGFMCYGPLVPNGYATCYNPLPASVNFATSAFHSNPDSDGARYRHSLSQAMDEMHDVLMHATKSKL